MKKRSYPKRRKTFRPRTKRTNRRNTSERVFSEVVDAGVLYANQGGIFAPAINAVPQIVNYTTLYTEYCIKKIEVLLMPLFTGADANSASYNAVIPVNWQGEARIAFAVQESTDTSAPISELDILQMNGCKLRSLAKPTRLYSNKPVPSLSQTAAGGFVEYVHTSAKTWLALSSPQVVPWMGLKYWISAPAYGGGQPPACQAYYKITFAVRDPR